MTIYYLYVEDSLVLDDSMSDEDGWGRVEDQLIINQTLRHNIKFVRAYNQLNLQQQLLHNGTFNRHRIDFLNMVGNYQPRVYDIQFYHTLGLVQSILPSHGIQDNLLLHQTITVQKTKAIVNTLIISQSIAYTKIANLIINQTLQLTNQPKLFKPKSCYIGRTLINPPTAINNNVVFTYNSYTLTLPAPNFNNSEDQRNKTNHNRTRGKDLHVFRDPNWPRFVTLKYEWSYLTRQQIIDATEFVKNTLGQLIDLVDYENRVFQGVIKDKGFRQSGRSNREWELEFELCD